MNWDDIGMMVGYNLANGYFRNQHDRWVDEGRKALKDMANVSDADRRNAKGFLQGAIDRNGFIGQDPRLLYLQQKQGYMQAANDKRYLLDNGYAADSEDGGGAQECGRASRLRQERGLRLRKLGRRDEPPTAQP